MFQPAFASALPIELNVASAFATSDGVRFAAGYASAACMYPSYVRPGPRPGVCALLSGSVRLNLEYRTAEWLPPLKTAPPINATAATAAKPTSTTSALARILPPHARFF